MNRHVVVKEGGGLEFASVEDETLREVVCPIGNLKVGILVGRDCCRINCAAFDLGKPSELRQSASCRLGNFVIGFFDLKKEAE